MHDNTLSIPWRGVVALYLFVEVTKFLVTTLMPASTLTAQERRQLDGIYEVVRMKDMNGRPMVYTPSSTISRQEEGNYILHQIEKNQLTMIDQLKKIRCQ